MQKCLVVICGPTGIGKTALSVNVAQAFQSVIISGDSRQLYKEMSVGTAVPGKTEREKVRHYLVQCRSVKDYYNASMYENEVMNLLEKLYPQHDLVFLVGGSGLYIDAVCKGIDDLPTIAVSLRQKWHDLYKSKGLTYLQEKVKEIDPAYYANVDLNNHKRLLKAIEVFETTGRPYSSFRTHTQKVRPFKTIKIGLNTERKILYQQINQRVDLMMDNGLEEEVRTLNAYRELTPLKTVGYKEIFDYFDGKIPREEAIKQIKDHSRAYARRQLTWFRRDETIKWFEPHETENIIGYIKEKTGL